MSVLFRAIIGLFGVVFLIFSLCLFLRLTCNNKAKSAYFRPQKYHRDFLRYFKQSRVILSFVLAENSVVIWKPKIPSMFAKRVARFNEYCCKQETLGTFVLRHQETCHTVTSKTGRSSTDGQETKKPTWTALFTWSSARELARIRPCTFWHFDMFTRGGRDSGRIEEFKKMFTGSPLLPSRRFSLTRFLAALALFASR